MTSSLNHEILEHVTHLNALARFLARDRTLADDLVQETLLRALANIDSFEPATNLRAWLFTILRNAFRTEYRKRRREVEDSNGQHAETLKTYPEQHSHIDFQELRQALGKLPASQREALILIGASGFSYKEAAEICGCAVGTVKSRVNRARITLVELLSLEDIDDFGPDQASRAVVAGNVGMSAA
jgi:RNA polymerase sigma-70 factor, ECF subfamily